MAPTSSAAEISLHSLDDLEAFWKNEIKLIPLLNEAEELPVDVLEDSKNAIFLLSPVQETGLAPQISPVLSEHSYSMASPILEHRKVVYPVKTGNFRKSEISPGTSVGSVLKSIYSNHVPLSRTPRLRKPIFVPQRTPVKLLNANFSQTNPTKLLKARENLMVATSNGTQPKLSSRQEFLALASEQGSPLPRGCRADNSLLVLTQKFLDLLLTNQLVNLNEAADMLKVPKRRLYDITNVLDGIDMINKAGKNSISLKNPARARQMMNGNQMKSLQQRVVQREKRDALKVKGNDLDQIIASLEGAVKIAKESPVDRTYCYVRNEDLRRATGADDKTLIVVKLPFATHYDVTKSNFDETNRHSCLIRNREGYQVKVTLLPNPIEYQPPTDFAVPQLPSIPVKLEHEESSKNFPLLSDTTLTLSAAIPSVGTIEQFNYDHQEPCSSRSHNDEVVMPTPGILPDSSLALPLVTPSKLFSPGTSSFLISPLKTLLDSEQIQLTPGPFSFDDTSHLPLPLPHLTPRGTGATLDLLYDDSVWHFFDRNSQNGL
ncbi:unnamed protein product, partial [Mesorhabditis belari]|uniref:E2F/DP family winged-helix DNA-binding domain-containing protein n=1 Tax=Mesorhabditis belari TaxID=2138241 RepID=A0AAF3FJH1_9BILA